MVVAQCVCDRQACFSEKHTTNRSLFALYKFSAVLVQESM